MKVLLVTTLVLLTAATGQADTLLLQDGRILVGPRVEETTDGVTVHFEHGEVRIPTDAVLARYGEGDPEERIQANDTRRHRKWRNRYREETPRFLFETTMSRSVFHLHRDRLLAYDAALRAELHLESPDGPPLTACFHGNASKQPSPEGEGFDGRLKSTEDLADRCRLSPP